MKVLVVGLAPAAPTLADILKTRLRKTAVINVTAPVNFKSARPPQVDVVIFADGSRNTLTVASKMVAGITRYVHVDDTAQLPADFNQGPFSGIFSANKGDTESLINELTTLAAVS